MKIPDKMIGFVTYENVLFPFDFDEDSFLLRMYPPSEEVCQRYNSISYVLDRIPAGKEHKWIPQKNICGTTTDGHAIIFNILEDMELYQGFPSFRVNWYYYYDEELSLNEICGFYLEGDEIDYFYPPNEILHTEVQIDEEHRKIKDATVTIKEPIDISCGCFDVSDGVEASIELTQYANIRFGSKQNPVDSQSRMTVNFSVPVDLDMVRKVCECIYRLFMYIAYRKNISLYRIYTFGNSVDEQGKHIGCLAQRNRTEKDSHPKNGSRIIQYHPIKKVFPDMLGVMMKKEIRLDHLCSSIDDTHHYPISRIIMILAAFEGEFERIYGTDYGRSDSYKETKQEVVDMMKKMLDNKTGDEKRHLKDLIKYVEHRDSSYKKRVIHALDDTESIMSSIVCQSYEGPFKGIIESIGDRMNVMRNQIAHCHLDISLDAIHISDFKIIEKLIYAIRLKKLGLDDESSKAAIYGLFGR